MFFRHLPIAVLKMNWRMKEMNVLFMSAIFVYVIYLAKFQTKPS